MLELLTATLFLLVAGGTAWAGLRAGAWRARSIHRLAPVPGAGREAAASPHAASGANW